MHVLSKETFVNSFKAFHVLNKKYSVIFHFQGNGKVSVNKQPRILEYIYIFNLISR